MTVDVASSEQRLRSKCRASVMNSCVQNSVTLVVSVSVSVITVSVSVINKVTPPASGMLALPVMNIIINYPGGSGQV